MNSNKASPLISVLVTVYNREKYLAECLNSILSSTFTDYEIVIVDDRSTDRSVEIAEKFVKQDVRIRLFKNEQNLGDYPNRNRAAELAKGKYLKYVDSDDLIKMECLEKLVEPLQKHPEVAYSLTYPRPEKTPRPLLMSVREAYTCHFVDRQGIFSSGPLLAMIRTDRFHEVGGFRDQARNMGDTILWLELSSRWPMVIVEDGLTWWRQHEGQEYGLVRTVGRENAATHSKLTALFLTEFLTEPSCPLLPSDRKRVRRDIYVRNFKRVLWHLYHRRFRLARFEFRWLSQTLNGSVQGLPTVRHSGECTSD